MRCIIKPQGIEHSFAWGPLFEFRNESNIEILRISQTDNYSDVRIEFKRNGCWMGIGDMLDRFDSLERKLAWLEAKLEAEIDSVNSPGKDDISW